MDGKSEMPFPPSHAREREREPRQLLLWEGCGRENGKNKKKCKRKTRKRRNIGKGGKKKGKERRGTQPLHSQEETKLKKRRRGNSQHIINNKSIAFKFNQ